MSLEKFKTLSDADVFRLVQGILFQLFLEFGDKSKIEIQREENKHVKRAVTKLKTLDYILCLEQRRNDWVELMLWPNQEAFEGRINPEYDAIVSFTSYERTTQSIPGGRTAETILGVRVGAVRRLDVFSSKAMVAGILIIRAHELAEDGEFVNRIFHNQVISPF